MRGGVGLEIRAHPEHTPILYGTRGKVAKPSFALDPSTEWCNLLVPNPNGHECSWELLKNANSWPCPDLRKQAVPARSKESVFLLQLPWYQVGETLVG